MGQKQAIFVTCSRKERNTDNDSSGTDSSRTQSGGRRRCDAISCGFACVGCHAPPRKNGDSVLSSIPRGRPFFVHSPILEYPASFAGRENNFIGKNITASEQLSVKQRNLCTHEQSQRGHVCDAPSCAESTDLQWLFILIYRMLKYSDNDVEEPACIVTHVYLQPSVWRPGGTRPCSCIAREQTLTQGLRCSPLQNETLAVLTTYCCRWSTPKFFSN